MNAIAQKTETILGTPTPGRGFPLFGTAAAETINEIDTSPSVMPRNTAGSAENIRLLEALPADIVSFDHVTPFREVVTQEGRIGLR
jgi:hypothetical protein